jgi:hypothetical protein
MTSKEIRGIAIDSAEAYYNYLVESEKGIQVIDVHELIYQSLQHCIIRLRLSAKLIELEQIGFKLLPCNKTYDVSKVEVLEYDNDKNNLLIKINDEKIIADFRNLKNYDIKVIVDLKFLVQRVNNWYKAHGGKIGLPTKEPKGGGAGAGAALKKPINITFLEGLEPSEEQIKSLNNIFTNPFTYVWGAPGTGKTQFVLAYAVLHYIRNNERVAIMAPTNNAVEQVLRSIIMMTDRANIDRKKILRIGTPSRKFAEEFPEVCENIDVRQKQREIDKQINLLNRVIEFRTQRQSVLPENAGVLLFDDEIPPVPRQSFVPSVNDDALLLAFLEQCPDELPHNVHFLLSEYKNDTLEQLELRIKEHISAREKLSSNIEQIENANVVAYTLDKYIGNNETSLNVAHIFLDEAGYASMIKALTLFVHNVPVTFLGDHKQLPPVCELNDLSIGKEEKYHDVFLWAQSAVYVDTLFARQRDDILNQYISNTATDAGYISKTKLNITYRFGANLATVLGKHVYSADFCSAISDDNTKILYVHAPKYEELKSRISVTEVMAIQQLSAFFRSNGIDYAILTPYVKQARLLGKHLQQERQELRIFTVHGSQGREWNTVLLSVVDTRDKWFVDSANLRSKGLNLINTAVSRAKRRLIIVCDVAFWKAQHGQLLTDLIKTGQELTV